MNGYEWSVKSEGVQARSAKGEKAAVASGTPVESRRRNDG
jgi:hypothetical protein